MKLMRWVIAYLLGKPRPELERSRVWSLRVREQNTERLCLRTVYGILMIIKSRSEANTRQDETEMTIWAPEEIFKPHVSPVVDETIRAFEKT